MIDPIDYWVSLIQCLRKINVALAKSEVKKGEILMESKSYPVPECGFDDLIPDAYDAEGHLTINTWELFKQDELSYDENVQK